MKEIKVFGSVFLFDLIISIISFTIFNFLNFILFLHKPRIGGGFGGVDMFPMPDTNSDGGYIVFYSVVVGTIDGIIFSILVAVLSFIFLALILWGSFRLPILKRTIKILKAYNPSPKPKSIKFNLLTKKA